MGDMDFKLAGSRQGITALQVMPSSPQTQKLPPPPPRPP